MSGPADDAGQVLLIVDDEPDIRKSFQFLFQHAMPGLRVIVACSGPEALTILGHQHVDLVLSDFKMPVMDGLEFLVEVRKRWPGMPRIMFTAYADDTLAERALSEASISAFLSKNLDPHDIVKAVKRHLP